MYVFNKVSTKKSSLSAVRGILCIVIPESIGPNHRRGLLSTVDFVVVGLDVLLCLLNFFKIDLYLSLLDLSFI
jgi:hypothetical protein